jgi:glycerol-3-phosphate dehydrogenase
MHRDVAALEPRAFDVLIIGAGIVGAATAWDAAQRGLGVALVEAGDFGGGTSWNSLKTIHGGLRHLQHLDVAGVRESVRERRALLTIAPAIVEPLSFVVPAQGAGSRGPLALAAALRLYDLLSRDRNRGVPESRRLRASRLLSAQALRALLPGIDAPKGGILWQDAQIVRPEALLLSFVRAAAAAGACVANYVEALAITSEAGRVTGARVRDAVSGREMTIRASVVVTAVGHALDPLLERSSLAATRVPWLSAINLVMRRQPPPVAIGGSVGRRHLFAVPWRGVTMIGTDYTRETSVAPERVAAFARDAAAAFPWMALHPDDVVLVHRGFVPGEDGTSLRSRDVVLGPRALGVQGLLAAVASKYTTARALAEKTVDQAFVLLGRPRAACQTATTTLPLDAAPAATLEAQVRRAVQEEMAFHLTDVVLRRTDVGTAGAPSADVLDRVVAVMAKELGWDMPRVAAERQALADTFADADVRRPVAINM